MTPNIQCQIRAAGRLLRSEGQGRAESLLQLHTLLTVKVTTEDCEASEKKFQRMPVRGREGAGFIDFLGRNAQETEKLWSTKWDTLE